jgi:tetratricopeptide (TPR) repeat protein
MIHLLRMQQNKKIPIKIWLLIAAILLPGLVIAAFKNQAKEMSQSSSSAERQIDSNNLNNRRPTVTPRTVSPTLEPSPTITPIPNQKTLTGGKQVYQTFNNCGPASLSMALSFYDHEISQQTLGDQLRPYQHPTGDNDDKSVTLKEMAKKAEEYGYLTYHRPAGNIDLIQHFVAANIPVIARTWLRPNEDIGHYRVVKGYDQNKQILVQDDSLQGKDLTYTYQDFNQLWQAFNYEFLVLIPKNKKPVGEQILGELSVKNQAWKQAKKLARKQLEENPNDVYARFNLLVAHYNLKEFGQAISQYELVANRLPARMLWYQIEPILAYYRAGQYQTVIKITTKIIQNDNRAFSELYWLRGKVFEQRGQQELAKQSFELAKDYNQTNYWKVNLP